MTSAESPLEDRGSLSRPLSSARYQVSTDPPLYLVSAGGFVGPAILRDVVARLTEFGTAHPDGWGYIVDVRKVVAPSIRNARYLRQIHDLPNLKRYVVVASWLGRVTLSIIRRLPGGPDDVVSTLDAAFASAMSHTAG